MIKISTLKTFFTNYLMILLGFIVLNFLFDFIDKLEIFYKIDFIKFNRYLKVLFVIYNLFFIFYHLRFVLNKTKYVAYSFIIISIIFLFKFNFSDLYVNEYFRYVFTFIVLPIMFHIYYTKENQLLYRLYLILKYFIILNAIAILAGLLFDIHVFHSYPSIRFGYNGFILSQGVTPYLYLTATILFWVMNDKKMLFLVTLLSVLSGIKGVYYVEFVALILLVLQSQNTRKEIKVKILIGLIIVFSVSIIFLFTQPIFRAILNSDGILSAIFSYRIDYTMELFKKINSQNFDFIIGVFNLNTVRLELQIVDIFLFLGSLGLITYIIFLLFFYNEIIKTRVSKIFFLTTISLSIISGNLFYIPLSSILFFLTLFALANNRIKPGETLLFHKRVLN